ncbi:MAG: hypothetical protein HeimC3_01050 [Candidatus Heimdallarchaeota archaeon LC_3]|nr:MAG: hypothetical protein HeimC3_01050 [Candidatus Heimdallarchaeota archaeon LC_3]
MMNTLIILLMKSKNSLISSKKKVKIERNLYYNNIQIIIDKLTYVKDKINYK